MLIAFCDTETTGLKIGDDRLVEIYIDLQDADTRTSLEILNLRINPQKPIAAEASAVHRITNADVVTAPTLADCAAQISAILGKADMMVAHNGLEFDGPMITAELLRVGARAYPGLYVYDTMLHGRWATPQGKLPNLGELCFACGVNYDTTKNHAADYDVKVMIDCFYRGLDFGFYGLPKIEAKAAA